MNFWFLELVLHTFSLNNFATLFWICYLGLEMSELDCQPLAFLREKSQLISSSKTLEQVLPNPGPLQSFHYTCIPPYHPNGASATPLELCLLKMDHKPGFEVCFPFPFTFCMQTITWANHRLFILDIIVATTIETRVKNRMCKEEGGKGAQLSLKIILGTSNYGVMSCLNYVIKLFMEEIYPLYEKMWPKLACDFLQEQLILPICTAAQMQQLLHMF